MVVAPSLEGCSGPVLRPVCRCDHFIASVSQFSPPAGFSLTSTNYSFPSHSKAIARQVSTDELLTLFINMIFLHLWYMWGIYGERLPAVSVKVKLTQGFQKIGLHCCVSRSGRLRNIKKLTLWSHSKSHVKLLLIALCCFNYRLQDWQMKKNILYDHL